MNQMNNEQMPVKHVKNIILGGGVSGLFLAQNLLSKKEDSFFLIEKSENNIGGFALWGDIKIGMPPAGNLTASYFNREQYGRLSEQFVREHKKYLKTHSVSNNINFKLPSNVNWKNYSSYIFTRESGVNLTKHILSKIQKKVYFSTVENIIKQENIFFVHLDNGEILSCENLIIATGRDSYSQEILRGLGEDFHNEYTILAGFRVEFEPMSAKDFSSAQLDFKLKSSNSCQTYCFNPTGQVKSYLFNGKRIYCGALDYNSDIGNTFIGKKIKANSVSVGDITKNEYIIDYKEFINGYDQLKFDFIDEIKLFMKSLEDLGIKFSKVFFPAMEQFWPKPILRKSSLESQKIQNLYYVGDSTGISYGFLQCYITASILSEEIS